MSDREDGVMTHSAKGNEFIDKIFIAEAGLQSLANNPGQGRIVCTGQKLTRLDCTVKRTGQDQCWRPIDSREKSSHCRGIFHAASGKRTFGIRANGVAHCGRLSMANKNQGKCVTLHESTVFSKLVVPRCEVQMECSKLPIIR